MLRKLLHLFFLFAPVYSLAQEPLYSHQTLFKVENGLPQGFISDITQDDDGFIWISTLDGLARYDGRNFMVFHQQGNDSTSINSNVINEMVYARDGKLWIFSQGQQVDIFNTRSFKLFGKTSPVLTEIRKKHFLSIIPEHRGKYWTMLEEKGISWIDPNTLETGEANVRNGLLKEDSILATAAEADGRIWLISEHYIQISDSGRKHFSYVPLKKKLSPDLKVRRTTPWVIDGDNFVTVTDDYLWFINCKTGDYNKYELPSKEDFDIGHNRVRKGLDGKLYLRNLRSIYRIEPNGSLTFIWKNTIIPDRSPTSFFVDRSNVLWVGLDAIGLVKVNLRSMPFNAYSYKINFHSDILGELGLTPDQIPAAWKKGGFWSYDFRYAYGKDSALYLARNNASATDYEIFRYHHNNLFKLPLPSSDFKPSFRGLSVDNNGGIWALDDHNNCILHWKNDQSIPVLYPTDFSTGQLDILASLLTWDNHQWVATNGEGLYKTKNGLTVEHADKTTVSNEIPYDLTEICVNPANPRQLWIGSRGGGMILWDLDKKLQRIFRTNDGLPNNTVYCIVPDKFGKLWLSTNKGICRFDPVTYEVFNFEKSDGLPGDEFNRAHEFRFPDGRIALGGMDGYVIFQPADFKIFKDTTPIQIQFTRILINNKELTYDGADHLLNATLPELKELILPYYKNYITISFAALQFNEPQKIKYRYRLKGSNSDWIESGTENTAYYTQLSPGDYELEINATNLDGSWNNSTRSLRISILPPFWKTWWAYSIYLLIAVAIVLSYLRYRDKQVKAKQQLIFEQREKEKLQELDEVKSRFFSNITHEFRTPLTLITAPLEKLSNDERMPAPLLRSIHTMQRNAEKLLTLINQLLDLSRIESGQMQVVNAAGDLNTFVEDLVDSFAPSAIEKNIRLSYTSTGVKGLYQFDAGKWEKCISNLLGNALKFTPENGEIDVELKTLRDDQIQLSIKDSGPGIPIDQQQKIFDRFYQADTSTTRRYEGTGIGLSLVKELVKLIGGKIQLQSKPGEGARFTITAPVIRLTEAIDPAVHESYTPLITASNKNRSGDESIQHEKPLVLVVEDNEELREFVAEAIGERCRVIQAPDGTTAWEMILNEMPELVVSDWMMPGMDGVELCRLSKNDPRTSHIGLILLTAKIHHESKMEGLGTGADDYIHKPFHLDELQLRIHNLLGMQERMRNHLQKQLLPSSPAEKPAVVVHPFLTQLYNELDKNLDNPQLGVDHLAAAMNMSKSTLNRKLKSMLDISTNDLIRRYRLQRAAAILKEENDISTVAYRTGFSSPSYFTQCFREQYGTTPSAYISKD